MHLIWHRCELRTHDHPGLAEAAASGMPVLPLVIIDPIIFDRPTTTARRRAWFLENVRALRESYRALGSDLVVREGVPGEVLGRLAREHELTHAHFIRNHTPYAKSRDDAARGPAGGGRRGPRARRPVYPTARLRPQWRGQALQRLRPLCAEVACPALPRAGPDAHALPGIPRHIDPGEIPHVASDVPLPEPGESAAIARLEAFLREGEASYPTARNFPALVPSTSLLSMYFNLGVLSPRLAVRSSTGEKWRSELAWWDFNAEVLDRLPGAPTDEFRASWRGFPWRDDADDLAAWAHGRTGFPMVDAGMRQLLKTGFMHNRVRLVTASFLTKHLLIDWRAGEAIFRGLLLCGDSAQNIGNWQWVAGCGFDASPYFRILNPASQGERFDPRGEYVRRWVPELADLPGKAIHRPWLADRPALFPDGYPAPMIDLDFGRDRFLRTARGFLGRGKAAVDG